MDVQKIKLIINNMESLLRCLKEEIYCEDLPDLESKISPFIDGDFDEVYLDET